MKISRAFKALAMTILFSAPAVAHTTIVASNIEKGAELAAAPTVFEFSFGAKVGLAAIELETLSGDAVQLDFEPPRQMRKDFKVSLPHLQAGSFVLKWRAVAKDGHVMRGEIDFTVIG